MEFNSCVGPAPPSPPVYLATPLVLHDRVTVTWNVSLLTYDPETYVVKYGTSMVSLNQESGRVNFTSVVVVGLEVSTRYYYQVEATNSNGSSTSDFSSFTTTTSRTLVCAHARWEGLLDGSYKVKCCGC